MESNYRLPDTISYSRVNTFQDCYYKYKLSYINGFKLESNEHMTFGTMAHKLMEEYVKGDDVDTTVVLQEEFDALAKFGIPSLEDYWSFLKFELERNEEFQNIMNQVVIGVELELHDLENHLHGKIDLVTFDEETKTLTIWDYKASASDKLIGDLEIDGQLSLYTLLIANNPKLVEDHKIENIRIGYINLPKFIMGQPEVLKSGKLSKNKKQKVSYDDYVAKIEELEQELSDYSEFLEYLKENEVKPVTIVSQDVSEQDIIKFRDIHNQMYSLIAYHHGHDLFPESYSQFKCQKCPYYSICKKGEE